MPFERDRDSVAPPATTKRTFTLPSFSRSTNRPSQPSRAVTFDTTLTRKDTYGSSYRFGGDGDDDNQPLNKLTLNVDLENGPTKAAKPVNNGPPKFPFIETLRVQHIVLGLIFFDLVLGQAHLYFALYDSISPPALSRELLMVHTLKTDQQAYTISRASLFGVSLAIRAFFLVETGMRLANTFSVHQRGAIVQRTVAALDVILSLALVVLHIALPARLALLTNFLVILRFHRLLPCFQIYVADVKLQNERTVSSLKAESEDALQSMRGENRKLKKKLEMQEKKMQVLLGDVGIMESFGYEEGRLDRKGSRSSSRSRSRSNSRGR